MPKPLEFEERLIPDPYDRCKRNKQIVIARSEATKQSRSLTDKIALLSAITM